MEPPDKPTGSVLFLRAVHMLVQESVRKGSGLGRLADPHKLENKAAHQVVPFTTDEGELYLDAQCGEIVVVVV